MLKLAYQYMKYYKSQTFAIFASIFLTAALLSGIGSLMYSSQRNDRENSRNIYGDWHYCITGEDFTGRRKENEGDFRIEECGRAEVRGELSQPYQIQFLYVDETYRRMLGREIIKGRQPDAADEIAADSYTLLNLGFEGSVGDTLNLGGNRYTLTGIVKGRWASEIDKMEIFVGEEFGKKDTKKKSLWYVKFDEEEKLYRQLEAFQESCHISGDAIDINDGLTRYLGGERPDSIYDIVKFALTDERGNFTYVILKLQSEYNLAFNGMLALLCVFSLFIVYSVFNISVSKRKAEYAVLKTLGIGEGALGAALAAELWSLFLAGYPLGCFLGNEVLRICCQKFSKVFSNKVIGGAKAAVSVTDRIAAQEDLLQGENALEGMGLTGFHVSWEVIIFGFAFLLLSLTAAGFFTVHAMRRETLFQTMRGDFPLLKSRRKVYSTRGANLANVVVSKFMFSDKKRALGIIVSLSIGGCIFLCTTYMVENLKVHAEMALKSDDGLGSEYRISVKSDCLADTIPSAAVREIKNIQGLSDIYASKYVLGELTIEKRQLEWEEYFKEANLDSYLTQRYGGICVEKGDGTYGIKYGVYGYDAGMIDELGEFLLEGKIDTEELEKENEIIAVANMDGQGNYNFYGMHPGDTVVLRIPKEMNCPAQVLKFEGKRTDYIEKEFRIAAIVSRPLAKEDNFLCAASGGWGNFLIQSFIMTNGQMEYNYGITDYSMVNAAPVYGADAKEVSENLLKAVSDVPKAVFRDYTSAIETQKNYLGQQQLFFSGIAAILLVISLFHILNSMNYTILACRREYGIIRAMGITDLGFYKMILRTGVLYGVLADLFIFLVYHLLLRRVMDYYMMHVVQFLHLTSGIPAGIFAMVMIMNVIIAAVAVLIPARRIAAGDIIGEIGG